MVSFLGQRKRRVKIQEKGASAFTPIGNMRSVKRSFQCAFIFLVRTLVRLPRPSRACTSARPPSTWRTSPWRSSAFPSVATTEALVDAPRWGLGWGRGKGFGWDSLQKGQKVMFVRCGWWAVVNDNIVWKHNFEQRVALNSNLIVFAVVQGVESCPSIAVMTFLGHLWIQREKKFFIWAIKVKGRVTS